MPKRYQKEAVALRNEKSWNGSFIFAVFLCDFWKKSHIILLFYKRSALKQAIPHGLKVCFEMFKIKRFSLETNVFPSCLFESYYGACLCSLPWQAVYFPQAHLAFLCLHISETAYPVLNSQKSLSPECPGFLEKDVFIREDSFQIFLSVFQEGLGSLEYLCSFF